MTKIRAFENENAPQKEPNKTKDAKQLKMTFPGSNVYVKGPVGRNLPSIYEVSPFFWFHGCSIKFYRSYWESYITD